MVSSSATAWYYTDDGGIHEDDVKLLTPRVISTVGYRHTGATQISDDDQVHNVPLSVQKISYKTQGFIDQGPFSLVGLQNNRTLFRNKRTFFDKEMYGGEISIKWTSYLDVELGAVKSITCALRETQAWTIMWTGVPFVDKMITKAGRTFFTLAVDYLVKCNGDAFPMDMNLEWDIQWSSDFRVEAWRFGLRTIVDMFFTDQSTVVLTPITARNLQAVQPKPSAPSADSFPNIYPSLTLAKPTTPPDNLKPRNKRSILTKLFPKFKTKDNV